MFVLFLFTAERSIAHAIWNNTVAYKSLALYRERRTAEQYGSTRARCTYSCTKVVRPLLYAVSMQLFYVRSNNTSGCT